MLPTYTHKKTFFNAYILPHIDYCCTVWGNINSTLTDCMIKLQKRAARIILDKGIDTTSVEMFDQPSWMTFPERVTFQKAVMMYTIFNNPTPSYLPEYFKMTSDIHQRSLRSTAESLILNCFLSRVFPVPQKKGDFARDFFKCPLYFLS